MKRYFITALLGFFIGFGLVSMHFQKNAIAATLSSWKLTPQPEKFTELYFSNHLNLPDKVEVNKPQSFEFTIHNLEYQATDYKWTVTAKDDIRETVLAAGTASLEQDRYYTTGLTYQLATASGRVKIEVLLVNQNQPIHYWLEE